MIDDGRHEWDATVVGLAAAAILLGLIAGGTILLAIVLLN